MKVYRHGLLLFSPSSRGFPNLHRISPAEGAWFLKSNCANRGTELRIYNQNLSTLQIYLKTVLKNVFLMGSSVEIQNFTEKINPGFLASVNTPGHLTTVNHNYIPTPVRQCAQTPSCYIASSFTLIAL